MMVVRYGSIEITIRASEQDMRWLRPLFAHNADPWRVLRDIGYVMQSPAV